tara:strand:+ start:58 stop:258 length:201 start_codon:yes stop_codon:yes gene_type:complete
VSSQDRLGKISDERTGADKRRRREEKRREEDDSYLFLYLLFTGLTRALSRTGESILERMAKAPREM